MSERPLPFLLFAHPAYYPSGGAHDFVGMFNRVEDAERHFLDHKDSLPHGASWECAHIAALDIGAGVLRTLRVWDNGGYHHKAHWTNPEPT